jgi:hypothetical protein
VVTMKCCLEGQQQQGYIVVPCNRVSNDGETLCEGQAGGVPQREEYREQSASILLLDKQGCHIGSWRGTKEQAELC